MTAISPDTTLVSPILYVAPARHGAWEVVLPEPGHRVACETLDAARRMAYVCAARRTPCEVLVRDAYHRVLAHELVRHDARPA